VDNRILRVELHAHSAVPAEAEVRVTVVPQRRTPGTEVRGRLMGPRCRFAATVEVAYHFRPLPPSAAPPAPEALAARAVIPEASLWEPQCPFLYEGPVELWQDGRRCDRVTVRHGLRTLALGPHGLRVNGRPLPLRGRAVAACSEEDALELRRAGHNLLLAPVQEGAEATWEVADRVGLFVLGRLTGAATPEVVAALSAHPSCLGWLLAPGVAPPAGLPAGSLVGAEVGAAVRPAVAFVAGPPAALAGSALPALLLGAEAPEAPGASPPLGWVS
jgi:hypothetical protein